VKIKPKKRITLHRKITNHLSVNIQSEETQ